jgi:carbamoyl-phosphate synthase small subunit
MTTAPTACLALADGTLFYGHGFGATGMRVAELCFNTAMTGYQEIMTDPSYAGQIVTFTFPHIGNVGVNPEDDETGDPVAEGMVVKWDPTEPSNWRAHGRPRQLAGAHGPRRDRRARHAAADARDPAAGRAACGAGP